MNALLHEAQRCIEAGRYEEAVEILCRPGPPDGAEICALIARAYHRLHRTRGDVYTAKVFAQRALEHGSQEPELREIIAVAERPDAPLNEPLAPQAYAMGGWQETRPVAAAPYSFCALSQSCGTAQTPKDFQWLEKNIPCQKACPAATDIPGYLDAIYRGDYAQAYRINLEANVFPAVLGRVCARPCEAACRHGWEGLGEPVAICFSKRSAADFGGQQSVVLEPWFAPSGKTVAVVGAGVAGLTAARELARFGHTVTVYEKHCRPGGMMNQGIPVFRLPREIIEKEIDQIQALGVRLVCNTAIGETLPLAQLAEANDAVVLAAGTLRPNWLALPGHELAGIRHGLDFLLEVNETGTATVGRTVVVIGGGFTAMDCARTAKRLGAQVTVCYRRTAAEMLVTPGELEELEHEGIAIQYQVAPQAYTGTDGKLRALRFIRTQLGEPDASGRRRPVEIAGSEFELPVDTVLLATGQFPDTSWLDAAADSNRVFLAGDFKNGASSLIQAIGHAKTCAREVDRFLTGQVRLGDVAVINDATETGRIREMDFVARQPMPCIELAERDLTAEVESGFQHEASGDETQRCYQCHYKFEIDSDKCIYCDWCIKAKPRPECILRIKRLHHNPDGTVAGWEIARRADEVHLIWINQDDCIRCGACVAACPVDAISIQKVSLKTTPL
jgi:formate dehydrogenase major subunit